MQLNPALARAPSMPQIDYIYGSPQKFEKVVKKVEH